MSSYMLYDRVRDVCKSLLQTKVPWLYQSKAFVWLLQLWPKWAFSLSLSFWWNTIATWNNNWKTNYLVTWTLLFKRYFLYNGWNESDTLRKTTHSVMVKLNARRMWEICLLHNKTEMSAPPKCTASVCAQWLPLEPSASTWCEVDALYLFVAWLCVKWGRVSVCELDYALPRFQKNLFLAR